MSVWTRISEWALTCGKYAIAKKKTPEGFRYTLHDGEKYVGHYASADQAKQAAEMKVAA